MAVWNMNSAHKHLDVWMYLSGAGLPASIVAECTLRDVSVSLEQPKLLHALRLFVFCLFCLCMCSSVCQSVCQSVCLQCVCPELVPNF